MKHEELSYLRKKQMADSLKRLMSKKNLKKITVQEIATDCGTNRYTFYYHFKDIYDLLAWMFQEEGLSLIQRSDNCLTWQEGFYLFLQNVRENKAVYQCAIDSLGEIELRNLLRRETTHLMDLFMSDVGGRYQVSEQYQAFLRDFYIAALSGTVMEWVRRDLDTPEETIMAYLKATFDEQIQEAFRRAERDGL